ncbi:MAG: hypothetical protein JW725_05030, partial [Candidatus Babeliaceae bacterium]|nr:hypothetical protein [Candidatus Babeliaceae bacterium]
MAKNVNRFRDRFLKNKVWINGYKSFHYLMQKPVGHLYLFEPESHLFRLSKKKSCALCTNSQEDRIKCERFVQETCTAIVKEAINDNPRILECPHHVQSCILPLIYKKKAHGFIILCGLPIRQKHVLQTISCFHYFVKAQIENAYREEEIEAIYENLHPRALAMSTMHTVHRIISSSLHIDDLLPRLARFTSQVLKADYSAIYLLDEKKKFLVKRFETGSVKNAAITGQKRIQVS